MAKKITQKDLLDLYRKELIYRRTKPRTIKEIITNTSYKDEDVIRDWENDYPVDYDELYKALEIEQGTFDSTIFANMLNKAMKGYNDEFSEKNGSRYIEDKNDTIIVNKDDKGNYAKNPPIYAQPLYEAIQAAKKQGISAEKAIALMYVESTLGLNPSLRGFLGFANNTGKEAVKNIMNGNIRDYKESNLYNPLQMIGYDHPDDKQLLNTATLLEKISNNPKEHFTTEDDGFGGKTLVLTEKGKKYFDDYFNRRYTSELKNKIPQSILKGLDKAKDFVENYEPFANAFKYFQENPVRYNKEHYVASDKSNDPKDWGKSLTKGWNVIRNNPELLEFINKYKRNGGMTRSLFNTPRRRRYDIGGARDNVNNVTGSKWGAGKGMIGSSASKAGGYGASAGAMAGSIAAMAGIGASLGSAVPVIGTAVGAIAGILGGIFAGRAKKRKAEKAAIEADKTHNYELGQDAIRIDQDKLNSAAINQNPIDIYGDNPQPVSTPGVSQVNPQVQQNINPVNGLPYRLGGTRRHYAGGGQILQVASDAAVVNGPSHEQGGVPYGPDAEVEGGEAIMQGSNADYIFSDTLKIGNRTFADAAKPLMQHKGYLEQQLGMTGLMLGKALQLTERSTYAIDRNTNNREIEKNQAKYSQILQQIQQTQAELDALYNQQEAMKEQAGEMSEPRTERRFGGGIRKFTGGGMEPITPISTYDTSSLLPQGGIDNIELAPMQTELPAQATNKGMSSDMASAATGLMNIGLSAWGQAAEAKKQRARAAAPSHVQAVIAGFRCGGKKRRYIDGGSIQVSPYNEIPYAENPTTERVNKLIDLSDVLEDIKRFGGITRKFDKGGSNSEFFQDEKGNIIKAAGNLLTGLLAAGNSKKLAKALANKPIPERQLLDRFTQEWDVNTDAARKEVIDQIQAYERFAKDNTSNAQIARQLVLKGRSNGSKALGKLKQDELLQEMGIRNETRKVNKDIEAKNKEIKYLNQLDKFNQQMQALSMLNDGNEQTLNTINGLFSDIGFAMNDHIRTKRERAANLIHLLNYEEAMKRVGQLDLSTLIDAFGKNNSNILTRGKRKGGRVKKCA